MLGGYYAGYLHQGKIIYRNSHGYITIDDFIQTCKDNSVPQFCYVTYDPKSKWIRFGNEYFPSIEELEYVEKFYEDRNAGFYDYLNKKKV